MRRLNYVVVFMFFYMFSMLIPSIAVADSVSKPTVTLPGGWYLDQDYPYPTAGTGEYDPAGCGLYTCYSSTTGSSVYVWYESAMGSTWTADQLEDESYNFHISYWGGEYPIYDYGKWTVADTSVGYTKGWNEQNQTDSLVATLVKNDVFTLITGLYFWDDEDEVMSIINSLEIPSAGFTGGGFIVYLVIGLVAAVAVIVAVVFWRRKKPKEAPKRTTVKFEPVMINTFKLSKLEVL